MKIHSLGTIGGVRMWLAELERGASPSDALLLDAVERERAQGLVFPDDRRRYVAAHAALRLCLAESSGIAPDRLAFSHNAHGKPVIRGAGGLHFSLSHGAERALIGVSTAGEIGVDIETLRVLDDLDHLATSVCTPAERSALASLPDGSRSAAFLECWTRKEACLKAVGIGLDAELTRVDVGTTGEARTLTLPLGQGAHAVVRVERVDVGPFNSSAALAAVIVR